ncbi:MAG: hypothetical protein KatS3mg068_2601 [Candidatus Sericytochromatia bacterium]|nr:MAG: hypothetical protein KatS3mg068_2601 [Candidatus Sericytochromatia bacterium]
MLSSSEILERVYSGKISFIGKFINIQYDSRINLPIDFYFNSEHYEILEIINHENKSIFFQKISF